MQCVDVKTHIVTKKAGPWIFSLTPGLPSEAVCPDVVSHTDHDMHISSTMSNPVYTSSKTAFVKYPCPKFGT